jgi:hypothetical protein
MYRALRYIGPVGLGATSPQLFRAETDSGVEKVCVVKLASNRLGSKVLVNEWLAAQFGESLKLCFPPGGLIYISSEVLSGSRRLTAAAVQPGWHFGCEYLQGVGYVNKFNLHRAVNKEQMAGVMLFDHLFHNPDRTVNRKNLIIRKERDGHKLYAIDNSHLFRRAKWTIAMLKELAEPITLNHRRSYGVLLKYYLRPAQIFKYAAVIRDIGDAELAQFVSNIPEEWLPDQEERLALIEFLTIRRDKVGWIAEQLCQLIPNIHRGADIY